MFRMLVHPSSGACDLFVKIFHGLYFSGSMCFKFSSRAYITLQVEGKCILCSDMLRVERPGFRNPVVCEISLEQSRPDPRPT